MTIKITLNIDDNINTSLYNIQFSCLVFMIDHVQDDISCLKNLFYGIVKYIFCNYF